MHSESDIQYALEMTTVLHEPDRRIDTFGNTQFEFQLVSELMDDVNQVRIRNGRIEAQKPVILRPDGFSGFDFEGFGPEAEKFGAWLREHAHRIPEPLRSVLTQERPIEIRPVDPVDPFRPDVRPPSRQAWVRAAGRLPDEPLVHHAVLAYASDWGLLGAALLAMVGAGLQGLFRNPLADPYLLGVSGGAALGSVIGLLLGMV